MGDFIKAIIGIDTLFTGAFLANKVPAALAIGFIGINALIAFILVAHTSRYLHNRNTKS